VAYFTSPHRRCRYPASIDTSSHKWQEAVIIDERFNEGGNLQITL